MKNDKIYLNDVLEQIDKVNKNLKDISLEDFEKDFTKQDAICFEIEVMGEAINNLSKETREKHEHIPWREIVSMRNVLIQGYAKIDLVQVWKTYREDLPLLKSQIKEIVSNI